MPEVRRLLHVLLAPAAQQGFLLHWSRWRRQRQAAARRSHYRNRLERRLRFGEELPL